MLPKILKIKNRINNLQLQLKLNLSLAQVFNIFKNKK